ncbi:MAG: 4Fe-4S binding protein [Chlamydiae bacterium]|nr:4Fe-4S binding protein [Chlamydiota bacterium]MBI3276364.1 4Fe-4S binding protein [Chlamydiota bacterium]
MAEEPVKPISAAPAATPPKRAPKPKAFVDRGNCTGCEICIQFCPVEQCIIKVPEPSNWQLNGYVEVMENKCIGCRLCVRECPWDAISMILPGTKPQAATA